MNEREADLIAARAHLKTMCDPRGHGLIDALVDAALSEHRLSESRPELVFACDPDESGGYATSDPKHPGWHSLHADLWDSRNGK